MILLVRPKPDPESLGLQSFMVCEPLELEYVATALERKGYPVSLVDMIFETRNLQAILDTVKPKWVAFTSYITHVQVVKDYAAIVKAWNSQCHTVVGGIHAEVCPDDFSCPEIDFILHAHAIPSFLALLETPEQDRKTLIPGIWNGPEKTYPQNHWIPNFFPNREITRPYRKRYNYIFHNQCALIKTSLGCAYHCDFCFCTEIARHQLSERPLDDVIAELQTIQETNIFIVDDNFLFRKQRVLDFCSKLKQANIHKKFILFGRADFVAQQPEVLHLFKAHGLEAVFMGLESFRAEELNDMQKKIDVQTNIDAVETLRTLDIECHAGIIVSPDWIQDDFSHLIQWLKRLHKPYVNIQPLTPMPGTSLFFRLQAQGFAIPRSEYAKWDMTHLVIAPTHLSPSQFLWQIMRTYYATTTSLASHIRILRRYGMQVYLRTLWGSLHLSMQYLRMWNRARSQEHE